MALVAVVVWWLVAVWVVGAGTHAWGTWYLRKPLTAREIAESVAAVEAALAEETA